jgi:hypothetical protein
VRLTRTCRLFGALKVRSGLLGKPREHDVQLDELSHRGIPNLEARQARVYPAKSSVPSTTTLSRCSITSHSCGPRLFLKSCLSLVASAEGGKAQAALILAILTALVGNSRE